MKSFPLPAIVAALAAVFAAPFSVAAAGTLFLTAALGSVIHADYVLRHQRIRLPRRALARPGSNTRSSISRETNRLAA